MQLASDYRSLLFADLRSVISIPTSQEYNVGLGYRYFLRATSSEAFTASTAAATRRTATSSTSLRLEPNCSPSAGMHVSTPMYP